MQTQPKGMFAKMEQKIKIEEGEKKTAEVVKQIQSVKAPAPPVAKPLAVAAPIAAQPPLALVQNQAKDINFGAHSSGAPKVCAGVMIAEDKVKEMATKLGVPITQDLLALGTNEAISNALIDKAVAAGKTEDEINKAMSHL